MQFDAYRPIQILTYIKKAGEDPLLNFVLGDARDELQGIQEQNLEVFLREAKNLDLNYVYFGKRDLTGCERKMVTNFMGSPAVWILAKKFNIMGCGNGDQAQIDGYRYDENKENALLGDGEIYIGEHNTGAWNIKKRCKLTPEEQFALPFCYVADRDHVRKQYAEYTPIPGRYKDAWGYNLAYDPYY
jgi:hypothetical protein